MIADELIRLTQKLRKNVNELTFRKPASYIYNPLDYAWAAHEIYLRRYANNRKKAVFLGMNPGPFGMAQTGIPFGEVNYVKTWLRISTDIGKPKNENPKRPIEGFACKRSEISGKRLWGTISELFRKPENFFHEFFVSNYCPLIFMEKSGRNVTPDKLESCDRERLYTLCDEYLLECMTKLEPTWVIGIGKFAEKRAKEALNGTSIQCTTVIHPSPASPAANRNWAGQFSAKLKEMRFI